MASHVAWPRPRAFVPHCASCSPTLRSGVHLWLPDDVYPEYWKIAAECQLSSHPWNTLPTPQFTSLDTCPRRAALLLPYPLTPLGRYLFHTERDQLNNWLRRSAERCLILDTVYLFDSRLDATIREFFRHRQTFVLHSLAKAWLLPDSLGVIASPIGHAVSILSAGCELRSESLGLACRALRERRDLPGKLGTIFNNAWSNSAERLRKASPAWEPPATGYFSVIDVPFEELLDKHGILGVPASVFGSRRDDLTVLSCLFNAV